MADHPHTIDRWDDATGENLIEQIAAVGDYGRDLPRGGEALAKGQDHAAQPSRAVLLRAKGEILGTVEAPYAEAAKGAAAVQFELDEVRRLAHHGAGAG